MENITLHLSLASPDQLNQADFAASDLSTELCLGRPSVTFNVAKNIPQGFKNHEASLISVLPDAATGDECEGVPFYQRPMTDPHESHQIVTSQNPPGQQTPAGNTWTFSSLPTKVENVNFQTVPPRETQKGQIINHQTGSGIEKNWPSDLEINPNHQFSSNLEIASRSFSKRPNNVSYHFEGSSASGAHSKIQSAKKVKLENPADSLSPIESSPSEIARNQPLTGAEENTLSLGMMNQPKGGAFTGHSGSSSSMNLKSQKVLSTSATNVVPNAAPHLRPERAPSSGQQQLTKLL
ncbi:hypothetical protein PGT21_027562 [Puccinia graminis f. sp. tritici]|uniref:Uncharacterized protein n=1 Tax=Puccinia graminis f. sp. tritici TaxID=56615 RepID=A0A5B0N7I7_PUCGR|nr:hypothetical protein PGT21_027562 [Puccinia graminis f. sp. tritici]KAA1132967.1 hypothetical protein PGTUg99_014828 [Puccinia graminis f. sp. tritici]